MHLKGAQTRWLLLSFLFRLSRVIHYSKELWRKFTTTTTLVLALARQPARSRSPLVASSPGALPALQASAQWQSVRRWRRVGHLCRRWRSHSSQQPQAPTGNRQRQRQRQTYAADMAERRWVRLQLVLSQMKNKPLQRQQAGWSSCLHARPLARSLTCARAWPQESSAASAKRALAVIGGRAPKHCMAGARAASSYRWANNTMFTFVSQSKQSKQHTLWIKSMFQLGVGATVVQPAIQLGGA